MREREARSIAFSKKMLEEIDKHQLRKNISRSDLVRVAVGEFLERESEKVGNKNEKKESERRK